MNLSTAPSHIIEHQHCPIKQALKFGKDAEISQTSCVVLKIHRFISNAQLVREKKNKGHESRCWHGFQPMTIAFRKEHPIITHVITQQALWKLDWISHPTDWSAHAWQHLVYLFHWAAAIAFSFPRKSDEQLLCADSELLLSYFDPTVKPGIFDCNLVKGLGLFQR